MKVKGNYISLPERKTSDDDDDDNDNDNNNNNNNCS